MTKTTEEQAMVGGERPPERPPEDPRVEPSGRWLVGLALLPVFGLLALFGLKMAANAGWTGGTGAAAGSPGIFTSGQLVQPKFRQAPDFTLELYSGDSLRLADLRGKPVMVDFWASWCPPCRQEAPLLARAWREYRERGVVFVGINMWDNEQDARAFLKEFDITFPTGPDRRGQIAINYGLTGIPEKIFIDRDGQVTRKWLGPLNEEALRRLLDEIIVPED